MSSIVANKIKPNLPNVINTDQTGFIAGPFIGENTRSTNYLIHHNAIWKTKQNNLIIVYMNFVKTFFDTIEWALL